MGLCQLCVKSGLYYDKRMGPKPACENAMDLLNDLCAV